MRVEHIRNNQLLLAAKHGDLKAVKDLLSKGAQIGHQNSSVLLYAAESGNLDLVKFILSKEAITNHVVQKAARYARFRGYAHIALYLDGYDDGS